MGKALAVWIAVVLALVVACSNGSQGSGSTWGCNGISGGSCACSNSPHSNERVDTCNAQSVGGGICYASNGVCTCWQLGCTPPRDAASSAGLVCDCATLTVASQESASVRTCSAPPGGTCCLGLNLAFCDCQDASGAGCGNAMTVPSCDISAIVGTWSTQLSIGQPVDDCTQPPESG